MSFNIFMLALRYLFGWLAQLWWLIPEIFSDQILLQCMVTCGEIFFPPRQCVVYAPLWYHLSCCSCRPRRLAVFACVVGVDANCKEAVGLEKEEKGRLLT